VKTFDWHRSLATGNAGAKEVKRWLVQRGHVVQSVEKAKPWQVRDVDFIVDGQFVEVKTDTHQPGALFAEVTVDGKPGYVFKSRADVLLYYFPASDVLYWVNMAWLTWLVHQEKPGLKVFQVQSGRNGRTWLCEGVVIPLAALEAVGAVEVFHLHEEEADEEDVAA
jgi:hypothetical protein